MALKDHYNSIAYASVFDIDKIYPRLFEGSFTVSASSAPPFLGNVAIEARAHSFGENVLPVMQFSTDNSIWYDAGWMQFSEGATLDTDFTGTCYTTATSLVIVGQNFSGSSQTCYYRAVLVAED